MSLFVFVSDNCNENARLYGLQDEVERFKTRVEKSQGTNLFAPFPKPYLVKKKFGGRQARLIADRRNFGDDAVVVFLAVMIRGDKSYEDQFAVDPVGYGKQHFQDLVTTKELEAYIETRNQREPIPPKPDPSDSEYSFLFEAISRKNFDLADGMVYETAEWKESIGDERYTNQLVRFAPACLELLEGEEGLKFCGIPEKEGWGVWGYRTATCLLLITPVSESNAESARELAISYEQRLKNEDFLQLIRSSRRAYPAYMLVDDETWVEIEKEPVANMALSPEESDVLMSVSKDNGGFPLFVNGRAGSGKSTILQYLFADLLFYYLRNSSSSELAPPVYLTANGELLRVARSFVERILKTESTYIVHNARQSNEIGLQFDEQTVGILNRAFMEFQPYLLGLLDQNTRTTRFLPAKRVDFSQFSRLWLDWFGNEPSAFRDYGPDVSWHVIRSYIKGMLSESLMEPDDYQQLPENQLTVTQKTFELVFERVWERRYSKISEGQDLWDDQDLARYVLENELAIPAHPAVFCDEAQDFTRIELEILLRLNVFSSRAVPPYELGRVPFAFAGDPFQTLNPTGFQWDAIKASYVEKFIQEMDPAGRSGRTDLNYRELQYNYRSTAPIVRFSNNVQALRDALFRMPELQPQIPWSHSGNVFPVMWFDSSNDQFWRKFRQADSFVVVVPCNQGEEADYVKSDAILSQHINVEEGIPRNVLSAARVKGREYKTVVVYGFGIQSPDKMMGLLDSECDTNPTAEELLPFQYFINKLYVAVSRPKQRLIVVDSTEGITNLWSFAAKEEVSRRIVEKANRGRTVWSTNPENPNELAVEIMTPGEADTVLEETAGDLIDNATTFEDEGKARRDPFLLRQASLAYRSAGEHQKASECRGFALELEGDTLEAGRAFEEAQFFVPNAVRSYWAAGLPGWNRLMELGANRAAVTREIEYKFVRALREPKFQSSGGLELLEELLGRSKDPDFAVYLTTSRSWADAIARTAEKMLENNISATFKNLQSRLNELESLGMQLSDEMIAEISFKVGDYENAVSRWEKAGNIKGNSNYLAAKANVEPFPGNLEALFGYGAFDVILEQFANNDQTLLLPSHWLIISKCYLDNLQLLESLSALWRSNFGDSELAMKVCTLAVKQEESEIANDSLHTSIIALVATANWKLLSQFISSGEFVPYRDWKDHTHRQLVSDNRQAIEFSLIRALARSDEFTQIQGQAQKQFSEFIKGRVESKGGNWRKYVTVEEAGAALERAGRFIEAITFYEALGNDKKSPKSEVDFAKRRWIVCKSRQLEYQRGAGGQQSPKFKNIEKEVDSALKELGIRRLNSLPKYPVLAPLKFEDIGTTLEIKTERPQKTAKRTKGKDRTSYSQPAHLPEQVFVTLGDFDIHLSRAIGRCNLKMKSTMQNAFFDLKTGEPGGEIVWKRAENGNWFSDDWKLSIGTSDSELAIDFLEIGSSLSLVI